MVHLLAPQPGTILTLMTTPTDSGPNLAKYPNCADSTVLYMRFSRLHHLRFLARDPMLGTKQLSNAATHQKQTAALAGDEPRIWATRTSAATTGLGFGYLRAGSHAPISGVNAGRKSLFGRDLLKELAEFFTFGSGQRGA